MKSYSSWPRDETVWRSHCQSFQPFHVRNLPLSSVTSSFSLPIPSSALFFPYYSIHSLYTSSSSPSPNSSSLTSNGDCNQADPPFTTRPSSPSVDILCINPSISSEFSGEESKLQYLPMKLHQYLEGYLALQNNQTHYLTNLPDIQLYLSQLPIDLLYQSLSLPTLPLPIIFQTLTVFQINIWINLTAVKSSLHYDSNHNLLIVYEGYKDLILISPQHSSALSSHPVHSLSCNHSNLTSDELEKVIQQQEIPVYRIRVNQGEAIFIPEGWWHQVSSGSCSYAMNYWFRSPLHQLLSENETSMLLPYLMRTSLHMMISNQLESDFDKPKMISLSSLPLLEAHGNDLKQLRQRFVGATIEEMSSEWVPFARQVHPSSHHHLPATIIFRRILDFGLICFSH
jgi:hypothetical protein